MTDNLFSELLSLSPERNERLIVLLQRTGLRIEKIISTGQSSPAEFWYDQPDEEWVALLKGSATIRFADEATSRDLRPGDYVYIPAHRLHRVEATDRNEPTVWLAIHYVER